MGVSRFDPWLTSVAKDPHSSIFLSIILVQWLLCSDFSPHCCKMPCCSLRYHLFIQLLIKYASLFYKRANFFPVAHPKDFPSWTTGQDHSIYLCLSLGRPKMCLCDIIIFCDGWWSLPARRKGDGVLLGRQTMMFAIRAKEESGQTSIFSRTKDSGDGSDQQGQMPQ